MTANGNRRGIYAAVTIGVIVVALGLVIAVMGFAIAPGNRIGSGLASGVAASAVTMASPAAHATLKVPSQYSTINSAIIAAHSGDTVLVAPGTYVEQLVIKKSISLIGSGSTKTTIQSPVTLAPDEFGNPWTIELGGQATVAISGLTVLVTPQCIIYPGLISTPFIYFGYAGGGIGVGGSAHLDLKSAVITTTGGPEGDACGGPSLETLGYMSYGTGLSFGLDYLIGAPADSALLGFGSVTGSTISGFGYGGPGVAVGGGANSPAGSSATVTGSTISLAATSVARAPVVSVGQGFTAGSLKVTGSVISGTLGMGGVLIVDEFGSSLTLTGNTIHVTPEGFGVDAYAAQLCAIGIVVMGPTTDFAALGILLDGGSSGTIQINTIANFECEYNAFLVGIGACGPSFASQSQVGAIWNLGGDLGKVVETNNLIFNVDFGILGYGGGTTYTVKDNVILNPLDWGLTGVDGDFAFGPNLVIGGQFGVGAIALTTSTTVTVTGEVLVHPSAGPYYFEVDFVGGSATIVAK